MKRNLIKFRKRGQMLVIFVLTWVIFAGGMLSVYNAGALLGERIKLQNAADSAAFAGAVWEARCYNYIAYSNRTIISQLSFITYLCALTSNIDAWKELAKWAKTVTAICPPISGIFSGIEAILTALQAVVEFITDLPLEKLPWAIGMMQEAMDLFLTSKRMSAMEDVAEFFDDDIEINPGALGSSIEYLNRVNHDSIYKDGEWEGLKKVLENTIGRYSKGTFNGGLPIYHRDFEFDINLMPTPFKITLGVFGDIDISKDKVTASDGPGAKIKMWTFDACSEDWGWSTIAEFSIDIADKVKDINLDDIHYYVFDKEKNSACGVYAIAEKSSTHDIDPLFSFDINNMFAVPDEKMNAIAKAAAYYRDPAPSSGRASSLSGDNLDPNLFNPFWRAELVAVKHSEEQDAEGEVSCTAIKTFFNSVWCNASSIRRH